MRVGDLMSTDLVVVGPNDTLRKAAELMTSHDVGSAIVRKEDGPGIVSERDILRAVAGGADPNTATVAEHSTWSAVVALDDWDVGQAARTMLDRGFRHLIVVQGGREVGILSIRDLAAHLFADV